MGNLTGVLIGCGAIAREHLAAVANLKNVEVAAVCDLSAARAEATAERFGIAKWYSSYEQMLTDIKPDLVHITTPPSAHFPIAKTCLAAGLNVLCEKPITVDYQDFVLLKQLAIQNRCMLMENQNLRFHSSIQAHSSSCCIRQTWRCSGRTDLLFIESLRSGKLLYRPECISLCIGSARRCDWRLSPPHRLFGAHIYRFRG